MAGATSRTILVCAFPAVITLLTFLWVRKKKKSQQLSPPEDPVVKTSSSSISNQSPQLVGEDLNLLAEMREKPQMVEDKELSSNPQEQEDDKSNLVEEVEISRSDDREKEESEVLVKNMNSSLEKVTEETLVNSLSNMTLDISKDLEQCNNSVEPVVEEQSDTLTRLSYSSTSSSTSEAYLVTEDKINRHRDCPFELDNVPEMSPPPSLYSDAHSEGSSDSGKGGSDIIHSGANDNQSTLNGYEDLISSSPASSLSNSALDTTGSLLIYEFELPQNLCGRLIGRLGKHVNYIKNQCNANIFIKSHPCDARLKLCAVEGTQTEIQNALEMIRKRFPISQFPSVTLVQLNTSSSLAMAPTTGIMLPETLQLHLPQGVTCDVILSSMVNAGHFFVQQPTHPTYPSLSRLDMCMATCYSQIETPPMPQPVEVGVICAAPTMGGWYRAQVVHVHENSEECDVKFVDYGGYACLPMIELRQIRSDFMTLPFQASECYLANVKPIETDDTNDSDPEQAKHVTAYSNWSLEASVTFEELAQGQILQALVVSHAEDGVPTVHLYRIQGVSIIGGIHKRRTQRNLVQAKARRRAQKAEVCARRPAFACTKLRCTIFINRELVNRGVAQWQEIEHRPTTAAITQG